MRHFIAVNDSVYYIDEYGNAWDITGGGVLNRPIKFRHPIFNSNGGFQEWHYWGFTDDGFITPAIDKKSKEDVRRLSQQYTGLADKNGTPIYEGDIIYQEPFDDLNDGYKALIEYEHLYFKQKVIHNGAILKHDSIVAWRRPVEVIGNKFENPELLEQ